MELLLGMDLGTTNIKAVAYTTQGAPLAEASRPTPTRVMGLRRAEHDPDALLQEAMSALREVTSRLPRGAHISGVAIASVGEAGVPLDEHSQVLYPIIAWYDERTTRQAEQWATEIGATEVYRRTGLPLGHTFTLNKLMWLRENEQDVWSRMRRWLCVADYVAYRLTGEQRMGYSLASRTMALDLRRRQWAEDLLAHVGEKADLFPELAPEGSLVGHIADDAALATGLPKGTPVFVGGHDHICGGLAVGACYPGVVLDSTGTTEAELVTLETVEPHLAKADLSFCLGCHVVEGRYYAIGSILGAGSMIGWLADLLWPTERPADREAALQALTRAATQSEVGARGLYVLPHLAGAGSPDRDSTARGVFAGLTLEHTRADLARAAIEGLAYELRFLWEALERFSGQPIEHVVSVGGGARNALWSQIKADVTGHEMQVPEHVEAVTLGAAILAGLGAGIYGGLEDVRRSIHLPMAVTSPRPEAVPKYEERYRLLVTEIRPLAAALGRKGALLARRT